MVNRPRKIVLSYSGGLDTSTVLSWLRAEYAADVVAFFADLGQAADYKSIEDKAKRIGATKVCVRDLRRVFIEEYAFACLRAGALYQDKYPMSSSISRPLLAKELVAIAHEERADAIAHGCSGKGNDQVRFARAVAALDPAITLLTPLIDWPLHSRDDQIEYAKQHNVDVPVTADAPYSFDDNLWGRSIGCGPIEDLAYPVPEEIFELTCNYREAPEYPAKVNIGFEQGIPKSLNGERLPAVELVKRLNQLGGINGVGRIEHLENKVVGIKSREIYECPAAMILYRAHTDLEELTLDKDTLDTKKLLAQQYAELAYSGRWFTPLKQALDAFVKDSQRYVSGLVTVELYKGNCRVLARNSQYALYDYSLSTYDRNDTFDHVAGKGFTEILTLPQRLLSTVRGKEVS